MEKKMKTVFWVAIGGALGAVMRFSLVNFVTSRMLSIFPWGTMSVNILGSCMLGYISAKGLGSMPLSPEIRLFLITGICGAFTTFSTFSLETFNLFKQGLFLYGFFNVMGNFCLGILALYLGILLSRVF